MSCVYVYRRRLGSVMVVMYVVIIKLRSCVRGWSYVTLVLCHTGPTSHKLPRGTLTSTQLTLGGD